MNRLHPFYIRLLLAVFATAAVWGLVSAISQKKAVLDLESIATNHNFNSTRSREAEQKPTVAPYCHIYDKTVSDDSSLVSKNCPDSSDLWFRHRSGRERFISKAVTDAKFSPDGRKIVYATVDCEVFIESAAGKQLAHISRALDPVWSVDGTTVNFSLVPSLDYPELQQRAVYHLASGSITATSASQFPSRQFPALTSPKSEQTYDKN